jgi:signal transduction histidine kinase/ActR/RegA family two-component response regulator
MKRAAEEVEQRILILAPIGRDAQAAARQLTTSGLVCLICQNLKDLCDQLANGGGAALIAEEAFVRESSESLSRWAARQPAWSDFPFVVLTGHQTSASAQAHRLQLLNSLGNVSLLERPLGSVTLVSALKTALRARRRQYEVQDYLLERELSAAHMEDLVRERTQQLQDTNQQLRLEIAERKQAEAALQQAQKMELIGQMTGGVAHDFNNLLTAVLGNLELASHRNADAKIRRYLAGATHAAQRGAKLTSQLLAFSRRQRLETEPTDLNALVSGMSDLLFRTIGSTIRIETVLHKGLWPALIDASQIELVILNLAINARDAMPGGGRLTITTSNINIQDAKRPRELAAAEYVVVSVSDTGTGMTEEVLKKVFEPFFTTKAIGSGTGLGLSQVYGIAKQTGGGVRIDTELGSGTTVTVYLPRAQGRPLQHPAGREATRSLPTRNATILVADDDHDVRDLTAACLESLGYSVLLADSGRSAIETVDSNTLIDLLMIDIAMPEMNGVEAGSTISARRPELPIIYMTGYVDSSALDGQGQRRLLKKPFTVAELELRVDEALSANDDGARAASLVSATPASGG